MIEYIIQVAEVICYILLGYAAINAVLITMIAIIDPKYFWETMKEEWQDTKESRKNKKEWKEFQKEWRKI